MTCLMALVVRTVIYFLCREILKSRFAGLVGLLDFPNDMHAPLGAEM